jgi:alkylation response protein AidB-like acyl-CoA dehydrogenase
MNFVETDEQLMLRDAVSKIARSYGPTYWIAQSKAGLKIQELWDELASNGFIGVNIPTEHGGGGMGMSELAIVQEECSAAGCPILFLLVTSIVSNIITQFGTAEQQAQWLPDLASGALKMAFAITEPDAGSNSHEISTTATRVGDGYRIDGRKYYISAADESGAILVVARTGTDEITGRAQLSLFVVDTHAPGVELQQIPLEIVGPEKQFTIFFDHVDVGPDRLIGAEGGGLPPLFAGLNPERITTAAMSNGIGRYALDRAADYASTREVWGTPIGAHQGIAHPLAKAKVDVELARLMMAKAAWSYDHGVDAGEASNMAKLAAADASVAALDQAIQTHGGNGMASEYELAPYWGLARALRIVPVSREMILNFVAQHSLRLPRSY